MKVDEVKSEKEKVTIVKQKEVKKELKLVNRLRPQPGQIAYEINTDTADCSPAEFTTTDVNFPLQKDAATSKLPVTVRKKIIIKDKTFYTIALNKKNAYRKYEKVLIQYGAFKEHAVLQKRLRELNITL